MDLRTFLGYVGAIAIAVGSGVWLIKSDLDAVRLDIRDSELRMIARIDAVRVDISNLRSDVDVLKG
ncbi:hypothetical protein [Thioalkalivibrio sp. HK1]|uniref:hypothetical protein n=1 Tax=Thioalkalivibrio sp. HK1 TaxID=1469245 RepID=UPI0004701EB8|nr:hypothetical protein [Thioalkalivibrio sp. HK1]